MGILLVCACTAVEEETGLNENAQAGTAAGATLGGFTGAAAGGSAAWGAGGMILGALLGGYLGDQAGERADGADDNRQLSGPLKLGPLEICFQHACVDKGDRREHATATYGAFLNEPVGSHTSWQNPATGSHGTTTIIETYTDPKGRPCKKFNQRIVLKGEPATQVVEGTACRQQGGDWEVVDVAPQSGPGIAG